MKKRLIELLQGVLFGMSCMIPGFSGGTMLVILGIYDKITSAKIVIFKTENSKYKKLPMIPIGITSYLFQLKSAFELISVLNSLLTSTFDGESKYTLCSTS